MTPWLDDGDVRLYHGDALETLRQLPDGSVDCVVTSPPYWGLRDYGTGEWAGGDPDCDHVAHRRPVGPERYTEGGNLFRGDKDTLFYEGECGKCGATRVDQQLGLEPTPDLFVTRMVAVFREIRRVLADHGTCWVNLGDSYAQAGGSQMTDAEREAMKERAERRGYDKGNAFANYGAGIDRAARTAVGGMKPKDLCGIPWRVAFALQADGWYLRSDIIWSKPNPMPESVTDRPTKAHEYVFLLTKRPRYWFDTEAVREPAQYGYSEATGSTFGRVREADHRDGRDTPIGTVTPGNGSTGRNVRSVWQIATQPYPEAHFATFPEELARRCILAGCPVRVCVVCGKPSERIVAVSYTDAGANNNSLKRKGGGDAEAAMSARPYETRKLKDVATVGWSDCGCILVDDMEHPVNTHWRPGVVLDPFIGSGTVAKVARDHGRHAIGIDLSADYLELAARRLQQLSLLT